MKNNTMMKTIRNTVTINWNMLKTTFKFVNNLENEYKNILINKQTFIVPNHESIEAYYNPGFCIFNRCVGAANLIIDIDGESKDLIIYDNIFLSLSDNTKHFLLLHETGHSVYGHVKKMLAENQTAFSYAHKRAIGNEMDKYEMEADTYAVSVLGKRKAITALIELWNALPIDIAVINYKEIKRRIQKIKEI